MQTKDVTQEIQSVIESLSAEGKEPTVALIRARLSTPVPMPAVIAVLKSWKATAKVPKVEVAAPAEESAESRIARLEAQVAALTERLEALERK